MACRVDHPVCDSHAQLLRNRCGMVSLCAHGRKGNRVGLLVVAVRKQRSPWLQDNVLMDNAPD